MRNQGGNKGRFLCKCTLFLIEDAGKLSWI